MGRIPLDTERNALLSWPGSAVKIKFQGTSFSATLSGINAKVAFYIDGIKQSSLYKISRNNETVVIAENLTPAIHEIIIRKASLVDDAVVKFHGIITDGELLPPENNTPLRIEYFGNSVSEGYAAGIQDGQGRDNRAYDDNTSAYTCLLSEMLNAEYHNISIGGIALCQGAGTVNLGMETRYDKLYPFQSNELWDFSRFKPDLCIMALGVNEFYASGGIPWETWREKYKNLVLKLQTYYGENTLFLFAVAPMVSSRSESVKNMKLVVADLQANGVKAMAYVYSFMSYNGHPIASEHQKMAEELYQFIIDNQLISGINQEVVSEHSIYYDSENKSVCISASEPLKSVSIYSIDGHRLLYEKPETELLNLPITTWNAGVYIIQANTSRQRFSKKIVLTP